MLRGMIPGERWAGEPGEIEVQRLVGLSPYVRQSGDSWRPPWHMRSRRLLDYLVVFIAGGEGVFSVGSSEFAVSAGDFVWVPPDVVHDMRGTSKLMNCLFVHFDLVYDPDRSNWDACIPGGTLDLGEFAELMHPPVEDPVISRWSGKLALSNPQPVRLLLKQICLEHRRGVPNCSHIRLRGLLLELLHELVAQTTPAVGEHPRRGEMLDAASEVLDLQWTGGGGTKQVAEKLQLSESHFRRLFKEINGITPGAMLCREKIARACEMLVYSGKTMEQIAEDLGYANIYSFSRAFKNHMSMPPGKYRRSR
ncbi:MAG: AraC family transcriptional regulator [Victivallales bacterium]|nr:AraC family transcriptional regulator [Victivallales bacterium]